MSAREHRVYRRLATGEERLEGVFYDRRNAEGFMSRIGEASPGAVIWIVSDPGDAGGEA